jgi:hypothetical protein
LGALRLASARPPSANSPGEASFEDFLSSLGVDAAATWEVASTRALSCEMVLGYKDVKVLTSMVAEVSAATLEGCTLEGQSLPDAFGCEPIVLWMLPDARLADRLMDKSLGIMVSGSDVCKEISRLVSINRSQFEALRSLETDF